MCLRDFIYVVTKTRKTRTDLNISLYFCNLAVWKTLWDLLQTYIYSNSYFDLERNLYICSIFF